MSGSMSLGTLFVNLNADSKDLLTGFAKGSAAVEKFAKETKKLANDVAQVSGSLLALGAGALALASTVDGRTAKAMDNLKKSTGLLATQVADLLMPAVREVTQGFKTAADWVAGLDPKVKAQISTWAVWAAGIAIASKALAVVAGLVSGVAGAFSSAAGVMGAIGAGPILAIVGALAVAAAGVAALHYAFRTNLGGISDAWKTFVDWISKTAAAAFDGLIKFATAFADGFLAQLRDLADGVAKFFDMMGNGEAKKKALNIYQALESARQGLLKGGLKGVVSDAINLGKAAGTAFVDEWKRILKDMGLPDFKSVMNNGGHARQPTQKLPYGSGAVDDPLSRAMHTKVDTRAIMFDFFDKPAKDAAEASRKLEDARQKELAARDAIAASLDREAKLFAGKLRGSQMNPEEARKYGTRKQEEQSRRSGMTPKELAKEDSAEAARKWSAVGSIALKGITAAMGEVGTLVSAAAEAIQGGGGIWGAIIAMIMEVVKKTESAMKFVGVAMEFVSQIAAMIEPLVKPIFDALTNVLGSIMTFIGPLFDALKPFAELVAQSLENLKGVFWSIGQIIEALAPIIEFVGELMKAMDTLLKPLLDLLGGVLRVIATVILGILIGLNEIASAFGDQKAKAEAKRLRGIVDKMWAPAAEARSAADQDAAAASLRNAAAQDEAAEAAKKVAEAFTNVPSGYKIALNRLNAMGEGDSIYGSGQGIWAQQGGGSGGAPGGMPAAAAEISAEQAAEIARLAEIAAYNAYADAIAAGAGYAAAVEAQDAARQAYIDANTPGKGGGDSQKSTGPGIKTAASSSPAAAAGGFAAGSFVIMGDVYVQSNASNIEELMQDIEKAAMKKKAQTTGNPFSP